MALYVVALAHDEEGWLTLGEFDRLAGCERVLFEEPTHPLAARLRRLGTEAGPLEEEPDATRDGWALVANPSSGRILDLARAGAEVSGGVASGLDSVTAASGAHNLRETTAALTGAALIMARLRSPDGCPWDREQTHESLRVHLLEEAYEVIDAIDSHATGTQLEEELGDVLLQVLFHARLADQDGRFDIAGVARVLVAKLIRRHPHVFGEVAAGSAGEVVANWEQIKRVEKGDGHGEREPFGDIPAALPALLSTYKVQKRAAGLGFVADRARAQSEIEGALAEADSPESLGRVLFWTVALGRSAGIDPEGALRSEVLRFQVTFEAGDSGA